MQTPRALTLHFPCTRFEHYGGGHAEQGRVQYPQISLSTLHFHTTTLGIVLRG